MRRTDILEEDAAHFEAASQNSQQNEVHSNPCKSEKRGEVADNAEQTRQEDNRGKLTNDTSWTRSDDNNIPRFVPPSHLTG
jgi:hypothetical protein